MRKKILIIFMTLISVICLAVGLAACGESGSSSDGTYYLYEDGSLDKTQFLTLKNGKWTDDENESGTYTLSGTSIIFYVELFGETEELYSGTLSGGVIRLDVFGYTVIYCKEGSEPSNGGETDSTTQYTVTYNANGGAFSDGSETLTQTVTENSLLTAPASPTRTGATFSGWATSSSGSTLWKFATDTVTKNITLYAVWEEEAAAIISVDGASISDRSVFMLVASDTDYVSLANMVVCSSGSTWRLYYDRLGLTEIATKIAAQTSGSLYNGDNVFYIVVTSADGTQVNTYELTIHRSYAVSVSYYNQYGSYLDSVTVYTGSEFTASYVPAITGYTFNGWKTGSGSAYSSGTIWSALSLYADCTANTYTATFNENGGDALAKTEQTVTYDGSYTFPVPVRTGYSFTGWYIGNTQLTDGAGTSLSAWAYAQDSTVTAGWSINSYTVTATATTGGSVSGGGSYNYNSTVKLTATTSSGYTFLGWYCGSELADTSLSFSFTLGAADVSYEARWTYYTLTTSKSIAAAGTVTSYSDTKITAGTSITLTATTYLGYTFLGWYNGTQLLTEDTSYTFTMPQENLSYTAT